MVVAPDMSHARLTLLSGDGLLLLQYFCGGLHAIVSVDGLVAGIAPLILCAIQFAAGSLFVILLVVSAGPGNHRRLAGD